MPALSPSDNAVARLIVSAFAFLNLDLDRSDEIAWREIINRVDDDDARAIPLAWSQATNAIYAMYGAEKARMATRMATRLDMFECTSTYIYMARELVQIDALLAAAALAANPAVDHEVANEVEGLARQLELSLAQDAVLQVLLAPLPRGRTEAAEVLRQTRWPGTRDQQHQLNLAPTVLLEASEDAPPQSFWLLAGELSAAGAIVRRVTAQIRDVREEFIPPGSVSVGWRFGSRIENVRYIRVTADLRTRDGLLDCMQQVDAAIRASSAGRALDLVAAPRHLEPQPGSVSPEPEDDMRARLDFNRDWPKFLEQVKRAVFEEVSKRLRAMEPDEEVLVVALEAESTRQAQQIRSGRWEHLLLSDVDAEFADTEDDFTYDELHRAIRGAVSAAIGMARPEGLIGGDSETVVRLPPEA